MKLGLFRFNGRVFLSWDLFADYDRMEGTDLLIEIRPWET